MISGARKMTMLGALGEDWRWSKEGSGGGSWFDNDWEEEAYALRSAIGAADLRGDQEEYDRLLFVYQKRMAQYANRAREYNAKHGPYKGDGDGAFSGKVGEGGTRITAITPQEIIPETITWPVPWNEPVPEKSPSGGESISLKRLTFYLLLLAMGVGGLYVTDKALPR
jgi:hypothetical protein